MSRIQINKQRVSKASKHFFPQIRPREDSRSQSRDLLRRARAKEVWITSQVVSSRARLSFFLLLLLSLSNLACSSFNLFLLVCCDELIQIAFHGHDLFLAVASCNLTPSRPRHLDSSSHFTFAHPSL